jgi:DNA polymerase III subunit epsilon
VTGRMVYFDLETAGLLPHHPDIQLAAIAVDPGGVEVETFEAKIEFDVPAADPRALELNHYTPEAWAKAEAPIRVVSRFTDFLDRHKSLEMVSQKTGRPYQVAILCGHNAASCDGPRLQALFKHWGRFLPADPRVRCTCQRALWWFHEHPGNVLPENYKLATLCEYFGIPVVESHEALADVRLTIALARALSQEVT